ncbi:hypothetical protein ACVNP3_09940 [Pseudomonas chlororaphis subsp. piscium]
MTTLVYRKIVEPNRTGLTHQEIWEAADKGLIQCWEIGRERAKEHPQLALQCSEGQLPPLNWKGGVSRKLKKLEKFGSLKYLAQWQGLRGENLDIDLATEYTLTCSLTGMLVTFTPDQSKYLNQTAEIDDDGERNDGRLTPGVSEQSLFS